MPGPPSAVAAIRHAVRAALVDRPPGSVVLAACSGGADSLALAAALAFEAPRLTLRAGAVVIDHGLQPGSPEVAETAATQCRSLGMEPVEVLRVEVRAGGGPEDAARQARYAALANAATRHTVAGERALVLLGHTRDDQAEQVLLGLARGSGARSLSGMPPARDCFARPLLGVTREQTEQACAAAGLAPWHDPHNTDTGYARVRARAALPMLDAALGPGLPAALARSAALLREDAELLDLMARQARSEVGAPGEPIPVSGLAPLHPALRRRVWLLLAADAGCQPLTMTHVEALDALVTRWRGQGPLDLPGGVRAQRQDGRLLFTPVR